MLYGTDFPYRDGAEVNEGIANWKFNAADLRAIENETAREASAEPQDGVNARIGSLDGLDLGSLSGLISDGTVQSLMGMVTSSGGGRKGRRRLSPID